MIRDNFRTEEFFPRSVTDNGIFLKDNNYDPGDVYPSSDTNFEYHFGTPNDRRFFNEGLDAFSESNEFKNPNRSKENEIQWLAAPQENDTRDGKTIKIKGAKQKVDQDDVLDAGTKVYGKSPRFDNDNFSTLGTPPSYQNFISKNENFVESIIDFDGTLDGRNDNVLQSYKNAQFYGSTDEVSFDDDVKTAEGSGVVFNTLEGYMSKDDSRGLRNSEERKFAAAGQIKRPLSQDEDVSSKNGRSVTGELDSPEVTIGDVGRMLNLGNALDGPKQAQPNKYLSLVALHLPVILRLSVNCPFQNVRIKCAEILKMVKVRDDNHYHNYFCRLLKKLILPFDCFLHIDSGSASDFQSTFHNQSLLEIVQNFLIVLLKN